MESYLYNSMLLQMLNRLSLLCLLLLVSLTTQAFAAEHLVGTWTLSSQTVDGRKIEGDGMTLRIYPAPNAMAGDALEFAYSMPVNGIHLVSLKFTSVHLDGREGSVEDVRGKKMGSVRITKVTPLEYKAVIEGANRPKAIGKMVISSDDKTLTSESDTSEGGKLLSHAVQIFVRH